MGFGDLLSSGNIGTEFAKALTVKVPRSKYGLIEGLAIAQKQRAAAAKAGQAADDDISKLKVEAANSVKDVDPKLQSQMQNVVYEFFDKSDKAVLESPSAQSALPAVQRSYVELQVAVNDIAGRSTLLKGIRAKSMQPNVLVPPSVNRFLNTEEADFVDDGLLDYPGWRERLVANTNLGWAGMDLPKKKDLSGLDLNLLQAKPIAFFKASAEGNPTVSKKTIEGRSFEVTDYKLSRAAIREQVILAAASDPDYLPNLSFQYYEANRKNPNFKQESRDLVSRTVDGSDPLLERVIDFRTDQIYRNGVYKSDELSGSKPSSVSVSVETGEKAPKPGWSNPSFTPTLIRQTLQDRSVVDASVPAMASTISGSEVNLAGIEGMIDVQGNEAFTQSGSFGFTASQILVVPVYDEAKRAERPADVQGKLVDSKALSSEMLNDNVRFETYVQGKSKDTFTKDGVSRQGADILYPADNFWNQNRAVSTNAQIALGQEELRIMSEMNALRDMMNAKDQEALLLFKDVVAQPSNKNLQARIISMAYDKGYVDRYKKGQLFKSPSEVDAQGAGPGIQTKRPPKPAPTPTPAPKAAGTKPAANPPAAAPKAAGLPKGTSRNAGGKTAR